MSEDMDYLVLARKWRPQGFDELIGQEAIIRILKNSLEQGKVAHAYLFSGPRGVGKTTTARILAKALNCEDGVTSTPCGTCTSCRAITDGFSVDVMEIDGASNNSVNDIRDLRERVKYVPSGGRYKVYIIDEAHMLSDAAFNALLKTLEEPPPHVIFVLATTAPKKIPTTVLSRCQHLPFRRIPSQEIKERVKKISHAEGITISGPALELIARASDGSLRDSLTILDQLSSFTSDVKESDVKDLLGITELGLLSRLAVALVEGKREEILKLIEEVAERGTDIKSFTKELVQFFRDLLVASVIKKPEEGLGLSTEEIDVIKDIVGSTSEEQLILLLSELMRAEVDVRNASSPRLALEMSLIKASFLIGVKPVKEILEKIETFIKGETPKDKTVQPLEQETASFWGRAVKKLDIPLASKLSRATYKLRDNELNIILNGGDSFFASSIVKHLEMLEQAFSSEIGREVKVKIETAEEKEINKKDLKEKVLKEPIINEALELFEGRITEVNPITEQRGENTGG